MRIISTRRLSNCGSTHMPAAASEEVPVLTSASSSASSGASSAQRYTSASALGPALCAHVSSKGKSKSRRRKAASEAMLWPGMVPTLPSPSDPSRRHTAFMKFVEGFVLRRVVKCRPVYKLYYQISL
jgi:hypothetical protein